MFTPLLNKTLTHLYIFCHHNFTVAFCGVIFSHCTNILYYFFISQSNIFLTLQCTSSVNPWLLFCLKYDILICPQFFTPSSSSSLLIVIFHITHFLHQQKWFKLETNLNLTKIIKTFFSSCNNHIKYKCNILRIQNILFLTFTLY